MFRKFLVMAVVAISYAITVPSVSQAAFTFTLTLNQGGTLADTLVLDLPTTAPAGAGTVGTTAYSYSGFQYLAVTKSFRFDDFVFGEYRLLLNDLNSVYSGNTNSPGTTVARLLLNSLGVERVIINPGQNDLNAPAFSLTLVAGGFTAPVGGVQLTTRFTGQFDTTAAQGRATLTSTVDGLGSNLTAVATGANAIGSTQSSSTFTSVAEYSITHKLVLTNMAITEGNAFNQGTIDSSVNIATPAPAGLLLAAFGIPAFGLLRRIGRKSGAAQVAV